MATTNASFSPFPFDELLEWHAGNRRDHLPWRDFTGRKQCDLAYRTWVSEIFLQQTQAERVIPYYKQVIAAYPSVEKLATASYEEFFGLYQWLGYYSRARNMLRTAEAVTRQYGGLFPDNTVALRALPGVGAYTAEAIRAFAYDLPTLAMDTNLVRIFSRYYFGAKTPSLPRTIEKTLLEQMQSENRSWRAINAALMDLGAATTGRLMIDFDRYPLPGCRFAMTAGSLEPVPERKKKIFPRKDAVRIIVLHENHVRYFSSRQDRYEPFFLEPSECEIRPAMQEYFFQNYGLSISVRPVRWHGYRDGTPHMLANAQPQTGSADLRPYPRSDHAAWESSFFTSCDRE